MRMLMMVRPVFFQAGARVQQVVDALAPHGLTLQNYASINEQQLGGFLQVLPSLMAFLRGEHLMG